RAPGDRVGRDQPERCGPGGLPPGCGQGEPARCDPEQGGRAPRGLPFLLLLPAPLWQLLYRRFPPRRRTGYPPERSEGRVRRRGERQRQHADRLQHARRRLMKRKLSALGSRLSARNEVGLAMRWSATALATALLAASVQAAPLQPGAQSPEPGAS